MPQRQLTREQELRAAIEKARLPPREYRIYQALFSRAEWNTAVIKKQFQPWNERELAGLAKMSLANVKRGLAHLELHGWITRTRRPKPGRQGPAVSFILLSGSDCDCKPEKPEPASGAERMRQYRARKKEGTVPHSVAEPFRTQPHPNEAQSSVTQTADFQAQKCVTADEIEAQKCVTLGLTCTSLIAGQRPVHTKAVSDEGGIGEGGHEKAVAEGGQALTDTCPVCLTPMDPWLRARCGFTTHVNCIEEGLASA